LQVVLFRRMWLSSWQFGRVFHASHGGVHAAAAAVAALQRTNTMLTLPQQSWCHRPHTFVPYTMVRGCAIHAPHRMCNVGSDFHCSCPVTPLQLQLQQLRIRCCVWTLHEADLHLHAVCTVYSAHGAKSAGRVLVAAPASLMITTHNRTGRVCLKVLATWFPLVSASRAGAGRATHGLRA
jgi:hypothetical protein